MAKKKEPEQPQEPDINQSPDDEQLPLEPETTLEDDLDTTVLNPSVEADVPPAEETAFTGTTTGTDPYYRAPSYADESTWSAPAATSPKPIKSLSTPMTLGAVGVIFVIMAIGLLIAIYSGVNGGEILTVTAGLCVVVIALVLGYAALRNLKVGWFAAASAVTAVALVPVVALGASLANYSTVSASDQTYYESSYESMYFEVASFEDDLFNRIADNDPEFTFYDWPGHPMAVAGETAVIDLTTTDFDEVDPVVSVNAFGGSEVYVLIPSGVTPLIYDDGSVDSTFIATRWDQAGQVERTEATGWITTHSQGDLDQLSTVWDLGNYSSNAGEYSYGVQEYSGYVPEISINIHAEYSTIIFIQVADPDPRTQLQKLAITGTGDQQSGAQSGDLSAEELGVQEAEEALARAKAAEEAKRVALQDEIAEKQAELKKLEEASSVTEGQN